MNQSELLRHVTRLLESMDVEYYVTGSHASSFYSEPRLTLDIDLAVALTRDRVRAFCAAFPEPDFYVSEESALDAVRHRGQFNVIHGASGQKIDVMITPSDTYDRECLRRRVRGATPGGIDAWFLSAEDVIIWKMRFYRGGRSEKHTRDVVGILKTNAGSLDLRYIETWADVFDLYQIWQVMLAKSKEQGNV